MPSLLLDVADRVATVTLNRPERRNALDRELLGAIRTTMADCEADDDVDVVILTGTDPAFTAGLDLKELGSTGANLSVAGAEADGTTAEPGTPWPPLTKPVIAAVNGPAVTGGLELVLQCDFVVASERASFGDTHARVGLMPGWGLSVLLPEAIGVRRAREMSLTGNFLSAAEALNLGLANHVVPHDELLPTARRIALDIIGNDQRGVRALLAEYRRTTRTTVDDGLRIEAQLAREQHREVDPAEVERRRTAIIERGRTQKS
jgi:enoyl-CoA hydratase